MSVHILKQIEIPYRNNKLLNVFINQNEFRNTMREPVMMFAMCFFINSYLFIPSTVSHDFAVISTHAGRNPLLIALRTDFTLHQAAQ